mmetsp:Transcript_6143/g.12027  ORF Transcript_6143/g.12027 Transcript_6143/m.12027 type:complete len:170 (+) Transcript_6143:110-619(+)|eukprot:jgi/Picre1/27997/NNA_000958.t1
MDVESKLGQSLDDLIKSQKKPKKKQVPAKGKKSTPKAGKKGSAKTPIRGGVGKKGAVKTPVSGGVKKASRGVAASRGRGGRQASGSGTQRGRRGVTVTMHGGKGLGYGLGPKEGVTRRQRAPARVVGTTGESINSRFEKIYQKHSSGVRGRSRGGGGGRRNSYGVVLPL